MNNNFYILPNEEGYLVKSYDTNSEIALFRSRRDAEIFMSTLSLAPSPYGQQTNTFLPNQNQNQYQQSPQQQIITPYPAPTGGSSPQVFFIQQPAAQGSNMSPYPYYPMMPYPPMGGYPVMNQGYNPQSSCGGGCNCGYGASYNEYCGENETRRPLNRRPPLPRKTNPETARNRAPNSISNQRYQENNQNDNYYYDDVDQHDNYYDQGYDNQYKKDEYAQEDYYQDEGQYQKNFQDNKQYVQGEKQNQTQQNEIQPDKEEEQNEIQTGQGDYYEQPFVAPAVYLEPESKTVTTTALVNGQQQTDVQEEINVEPQPPIIENPIELGDDDFFSFINDEDFGNDGAVNKKDSKRLAKEAEKAAKLASKLEKQKSKKSKPNQLDIDELDIITE